jgi:hypothetical protein
MNRTNESQLINSRRITTVSGRLLVAEKESEAENPPSRKEAK